MAGHARPGLLGGRLGGGRCGGAGDRGPGDCDLDISLSLHDDYESLSLARALTGSGTPGPPPRAYRGVRRARGAAARSRTTELNCEIS